MREDSLFPERSSPRVDLRELASLGFDEADLDEGLARHSCGGDGGVDGKVSLWRLKGVGETGHC